MVSKTGIDGVPQFRHFGSANTRAMIIPLRSAVSPVLANNILNHFTDHSVAHSDSLCALIDDLIEPIQDTENPLSDDELLVVYSACYLHDLGMQYENAGTTEAIRGTKLPLPWEELEERTRLDLLREKHHLISAELVTASAGPSTPPVGLMLTDHYRPTQIACLCEAHCVTPGTQRYAELMEEAPRIRMPLLSALLRLADILDESCHRAYREKARSLMLDLESQTHWWGHYYTRGVSVDPESKTITVWFEFPPDRASEYERVIPELQIPSIRAELEHHRATLNQVGVGWTLETKQKTPPYSTLEKMPEPVLGEMLKQLRRRQLIAEEKSREVALEAFKAARPSLERRLDDLRSKKESVPTAEYLKELSALAQDLWDIGSRRSAWMSLSGPFHQAYASLPLNLRLDIGCQLMRMMIDDDVAGLAKGWGGQLAKDIKAMPESDPKKMKAQTAIAEWFFQICDYEDAADALARARDSASSDLEKDEADARLRELHFLQGELDKAIE